MHVPTLGIIGLGLIGGSIALSARKRALAGRIVGCDRSEGILARARDLGMLDDTTTDPCTAARQSSLVVICTPVDRIIDTVTGCCDACRPGTLLTDVGSTKTAIVRRLAGRMPPGVHFVGSHPVAGSEKNGPEHASADLFDGRVVVVTPVSDPPVAVSTICGFWRALGGQVETMSPEHHDEVLALTSHLPHLVSSVLASVLPLEWRRLTGSGFRDTTRLAAGSPELWQAIFSSNRPALLDALEQFRGHLEMFRSALAAGDGERVRLLLEQGKYVRDSLAER
jgi:prephenate dehydrogenase